MNKAFISLIFLIGFFSVVSAIGVTVIQPNGGETVSGNYEIKFLVDGTGSDISAKIYYDNNNTPEDGNTVITSFLDLDASNCGDTDYSTPNTCTYSWNSLTAPDGTYFVYVIIVNDGNPSQILSDYSDNSFSLNNAVLDTTPPVTTSDANSSAQNFAANVKLTCADADSGCALTQWRLDGGSWTTYASLINISAEGTHTLDFNSTDAAGNMETMKTATIIIDTTSPSSGSISLPDYTNSSTPSISLSSSGANKMRFSCNGTDFSSPVDFSTTYSGYNITTNTGCNSNNETKTIFVQFGDTAGNWNNSSVSDTTFFDTSSPSTPIVDTTIEGSTGIRATWNSS
ncbi:MAG: hypothetical protein Q7R33_06530, partial [Nitrosarchaeum sp.]|nr:hypothetical protein [Nitrosarchaeum sp.]